MKSNTTNTRSTKTTNTTTKGKSTMKTSTAKKAPAGKTVTAKAEKTTAKKQTVKKPEAVKPAPETVKPEAEKQAVAQIGKSITREQYKDQAALWAACDGAKADTPYELWYFLQQITLSNSEDSRPTLRHCYSTGEELYATNGKLLAIVPTTLPRGFYDPAVIGKGKKGIHNFIPVYNEGTYPYVEAVVPKTEGWHTVNANFKVDNPLHAELFAFQFTLATVGKGLVFADQMLDFIASTCAEYKVSFREAGDPAVFENETLKIVAMPVRGADDSQILTAIRNYRDQIRAAVKAGKEPEAIGMENTPAE